MPMYGVGYPMLAPDGTVAAPSYSFGSEPGLGFRRAGTGTVHFTYAGAERIAFNGTGALDLLSNTMLLRFGASQDTVLVRDGAANTLALRNGTAAQTFRAYRSYTDASNYSRFNIGWNTSTALLQATGAGTGTNGNVAFGSAALATGATVGYVMIPSCAGPPTGVPADIPTGQVALHFDTTNNKLHVYDGGWLSSAALT